MRSLVPLILSIPSRLTYICIYVYVRNIHFYRLRLKYLYASVCLDMRHYHASFLNEFFINRLCVCLSPRSSRPPFLTYVPRRTTASISISKIERVDRHCS